MPGLGHISLSASGSAGSSLDTSSGNNPECQLVSTDTGITPRVTADATPSRASAPNVHTNTRASVGTAITAASSDEARSEALRDYEFDKVANSARASKNSTWKTWKRLHVAWFGHSTPPLPLTVTKIKRFASLFKAGHYSSFANYASRAKLEHISMHHVHGQSWSEELTIELRQALRSVTRGLGVSKQAYPRDLSKVASLGTLDNPVVDGGPIGPTDFAVLGIFFLTREIELSCARCSHISLDVKAAEITWTLPVSKNDIRAVGTTRTWGCICDSSTTVACPFHAALRQLERLRALAALQGKDINTLPLFPSCNGDEVTKGKAVETIVFLAGKCGLPTVDSAGKQLYGGHSLRTGGAVALANLGLDSTKIECMARWNSPMLMHYIRSAPLKSITAEFQLHRRLKESKHNLQNTAAESKALRAAIGSLIKRLAQNEASMDEWSERVEALEDANAPSQFVRNIESGIWHFSRTHTAGMFCKTTCGWSYAGLAIEVASSISDKIPHKSLCGRCLPSMRLLASMD